MRVIITAGGTGGHIYPALAVLDKIKNDKNNEYLYIGTKDRMESELIPKLNIPYESLEVYGLSTNILKNIKNISCIRKSYKKALKIMNNFKPDIIIAFGGYVTIPVVLAAHKLKIKITLHEQNYIPGKANKYVSKYADAIFTSFEGSKKYFENKKVIYSGNPCGERATKMPIKDKTTLGFTKHKKLILIVMGSMGSSAMSDKIKEFLKTFEENDKEILFISGKNLYDELKKLTVPKSTKIVDYIDNLPGLMKNADLIISRAGASTISEILALNIPSILIPSPYVANNHQYYNAMDLKNKNLSVLLEQKDLTSETLKLNIKNILDDKKIYLSIIKTIKESDKKEGARIIYDSCKQIVGE